MNKNIQKDVCTQNPNGAPCFDWKFGPSFGGLFRPKIEDIHRFPGMLRSIFANCWFCWFHFGGQNFTTRDPKKRERIDSRFANLTSSWPGMMATNGGIPTLAFILGGAAHTPISKTCFFCQQKTPWKTAVAVNFHQLYP